MNRKLSLLTLSALLALGAVGCSKGSSPTEPAFDLEDSAVAASSVSEDSSLAAVSEESRGRGRGGNDDNSNANSSGRRGRGGRGGGDNANRPDDNPRPARAGQEFEAAVTAVNGQTLVLANGTRVVVNGQTQWSARGDLLSLSQVAGAVSANRPVRAEGRGTRQSDGTLLATTLKVEVDD